MKGDPSPRSDVYEIEGSEQVQDEKWMSKSDIQQDFLGVDPVYEKACVG